jgi:cupin superfamily acireductone dioxygenase involved in methionine salvage
MPNNLQDDEGYLVLKDTNGEVYSILPKEGEFIIHESNIDHYPKEATNSSVDRIVIAGNVGF